MVADFFQGKQVIYVRCTTGERAAGLLQRRTAGLSLILFVCFLVYFSPFACRAAGVEERAGEIEEQTAPPPEQAKGKAGQTGEAARQAGGNARSFLYFFAHRALPQTLYADPDLAVLLSLSDKRQEYLAKMWGHYWKAFSSGSPASASVSTAASPPSSTLAPEGPTVIFSGVIGDNIAMALIAMPEPESAPEAYYCCVIVTYAVDRAAGKLLASGMSYYTLEKSVARDFPEFHSGGRDASGEKNEPVKPDVTNEKIVATVIGGWSKDGVHHNYGEGPPPDEPTLFLEAVFQLYGEPGEKHP